MKRRLLLASLVVPFLVKLKEAAALVPVECTNCSEFTQQLLEYGRQAEQLANEAASLKTQLAQYANMVTNTISIPLSIWSDVSRTTSQVRNLANAASLLTGHSGTIMNRLNSAEGLAYSALATPQAAYNQYNYQRQNVGNAVSSLGRVLGVQQDQEVKYAALQEQMQLHSQGAEGQKQAVQAGNEMLALSNTQLNQIQSTLTAQAQVMAAKAESDEDRRALNDFAKQQFFAATPISMGGNTYP